MAKKKTSKQKQFLADAALQSLVKFGPQLDILKQAQTSAQDQYKSSIAQADSGRVGVQQAVDAVVPQLAGIYDKAGLDAARTSQTLIGHDLAGLSNVADSIKGGAALEAAGMGARLGEAKTQAFTDLANRRVQATTGAVTAKRQAQSELVSNLAKILQSQKDLTGQQGTFEASAVNDLVNKDADRSQQTSLNNADNSQSERNSLRSSGIDPNTLQPIPGGKLDPAAKVKKPKYATPQQHGALKDSVDSTLQLVRDMKADGSSRAEIAHDLVNGVAAQTFTKDPKTGEKLKAPVHDPGVPKTKALVASVALDLAFDQHISDRNVRELHRRRFKVKTLGLPTRNSLSPVQQAYQGAQQTARGATSFLTGG